MVSRDIFRKSGKSGRRPRTAAGLKLSSGLKSGGLDPNHSRRPLALSLTARVTAAVAARAASRRESDRAFAAADVRFARREHVIERVRQDLARAPAPKSRKAVRK